jgi:hypothetical protein
MKEALKPELVMALDAICIQLSILSEAECKQRGWTLVTRYYWKERSKFVAIDSTVLNESAQLVKDTEGSGYWLVEKSTGEIYNIKGYGVPDHNKKLKSNIGNIYTVDAARLFAMRHNYLG